MIYGSVCSGIESASVAWEPLGWKPAFFAEIDDFPCAVLAHHYPRVPNLGDFTKIEADDVGPTDLLVGGTPCQSFSVAGKRLGLDDARGNLALEFLALARRLRPRWLVFENVPGLLSSDEGRDFGAFLGLLGELGYGWAYRILDAQFIRVDGYPRAVPQRRRRVFVVGHLGDARPAAAVLFEREGMFGYPSPRREAGKGAAPTIAARPTGGGGLGTDFDIDGGLIPANDLDGASHAITARHSATGRYDPNGETFVAATLEATAGRSRGAGTPPSMVTPGFIHPRQIAGSQTSNQVGIKPDAEIADALTSEGPGAVMAFDARQRDVPVLGDRAMAIDTDGYSQAIAFDTTQITHPANRSVPKDLSPQLSESGHPPAVAFSCKDAGQDAAPEVTPTLRSMNEINGNANAGGQLAVAFQARIGRNGRGYEQDIAPALNGADAGATSDMRPCVAFKPSHYTRDKDCGPSDVVPPLTKETDKGDQDPVLFTGVAVRRLTPIECERLQGFPDGYTHVPYRGKKAKDGPRYKALGNAMAIPPMRWIGARISICDRMLRERGAI